MLNLPLMEQKNVVTCVTCHTEWPPRAYSDLSLSSIIKNIKNMEKCKMPKMLRF